VRPWIVGALLLAGCTSVPEVYRPPIVLTHNLQPGERVICDNWFFWIGLPLADPATAVLAYQRHHFECTLQRSGSQQVLKKE
jgi:hypothetical protein